MPESLTPRRPPADLTPTAILESWLPEAFAAGPSQAEGTSPALYLSLSGPEGGDWKLQICEGTLAVERLLRRVGTRLEDPDIWIRQSAADFLSVLFPCEDLIELLPPSKDIVDLLSPESQEMDLLSKLDGRIRFELEGRRRRRWSVDVALGRSGMLAGRPRTSVIIDAGTCEKLAARTLSPLQALLAGRLRVEGDKTLAMQVLMLAAARMGR